MSNHFARSKRKEEQIKSALSLNESLGKDCSLLVGQVMTRVPSTVLPEDSVLDIINLFHEKEFRHLLVVEADGHFRGIVSDRDVLRWLGPEGRPNREVVAALKVEQVMSSDVVTIGSKCLLSDAVDIMIREGINCLPVIEGGNLEGIITSTDMLLALKTFMATHASPIPISSESV